MINTQEVPQHVWDSLSKPLIPIILEFYKDPENRRKFEEWHYKKYGAYPTNASYISDKQPVD